MANPTANPEIDRLLQLAEEYRNKGYDISLHPTSENLPDFLRNYRPDMIVRRGDETIIVEVKSRRSLGSSAKEYLRNLARSVEQHPGWRLEFVMTNSEDYTFSNPENSLRHPEIEARLQVAKQLAAQHLESAILYSWSLVEATLRLVAEHEGLALKRLDSLYLLKQLVTEGVISRHEYQLLMDLLSKRNMIAHGFQSTQITQDAVYELIDVAEELLKTLHTNDQVD